MTKKIVLFLFIIVPLFASNDHEISKQILLDFEEYAQKAMKEWEVPGMAIGIVQGDKVVYSKGFGKKRVEGNDPIDIDTIFQIGSVTKSFTATLVAMLVNEGKFKWDDKVSYHLPDFMMYDPWVTRECEVVDLMAQRSGLTSHVGDFLFILGYDRSYITRVLRYIEPVTSFRSQYAYVNLLFLVAGDLIQKASGRSWERNIQDRIFTPLEMTHSSTDEQSFIDAKNSAFAHVKVDNKIVSLGKDWPFLGWGYIGGPAGSINSNITDMMKWVSFQFNKGKVEEKQLVSENNLNFIHSPKTPITDNVNGGNLLYALGWVYKENNPDPIIWHNGEVTGMKSMVAFTPNEKIGIVILSNYSTQLPELLASRFFDHYFGKKLEDISGEVLSAVNKAKEQQKSQGIAPPKNPRKPLPLDQYAGEYVNKIYGTVKISVADEKLLVAMGNNEILKMNSKNWDGDTFEVYGAILSKEDKAGFLKFEVDPRQKVNAFYLELLEEPTLLNQKFEKLIP